MRNVKTFHGAENGRDTDWEWLRQTYRRVQKAGNGLSL
jgi:hypothetical protein